MYGIDKDWNTSAWGGEVNGGGLPSSREPQYTRFLPYASTSTLLGEKLESGCELTQESGNYPIVTGGSVVAIKFDTGVAMGADNLISYGKMSRYHDVQRVQIINAQTILSFSGEYANFQQLMTYVKAKNTSDAFYSPNGTSPKELFSWAARLFYVKRCHMEPSYLTITVGGIHNGEPFLSQVDMRGQSQFGNIMASGMSRHTAPAVVKSMFGPDHKFTEEDAKQAIRKCLEVGYYRDCWSSPNYTLCVVTPSGSSSESPLSVPQNWIAARNIKGY